MKRIRFFFMLLVPAILLFVSACGSAPASAPADQPAGDGGGSASSSDTSAAPPKEQGKSDNLVMGTSSSGSSLQVLAVGFADLFSKEGNISTRAQASGGSDASVNAIDALKIDMAIATSPAIYNAFKGEGIYQKPVPLVALFGASQSEPRQLVVRADSGIETPADLAGKNFMGERSAVVDITQLSYAIMEAYGVDKNSVTMINATTTNEQTEALQAGTVPAATLPGGIGSAPIMQAAQNADLKFFNFPEDKLNQILEIMGPAYTKSLIPAGTYKGQDQDVVTPGISSMLISKENVISEQTAYTITKILWENPDKVEAIHSAAKDWMPAGANPPVLPIPYHAGSVKYFEEKGVWTPELQANQEQLTKK